MNRHNQGLTLIELIIVIAISTILIILAIPPLSDFVSRIRITSQINELVRIIQMARQTAIFRNRQVTLCRSNNTIDCQGNWHEGLILFIDVNHNRKLDNNEELIFSSPALREGDKLFWRAFRNRQYLIMTPRGYTAFQNGTFTYCPSEGIFYAKAIIISASGRLRFSTDNNSDGIHEGADGNPLRCS